MRARPFSLPLVGSTEVLRGTAPVVLERSARSCQVGDRVHRGCLFTVSAVVRSALGGCLPPSARPLHVEALELAEAWARGEVDLTRVKQARSMAFNATAGAERRALGAIESQLAAPRQTATALDPHADQVVLRYVGLGAYYAIGALLLTLDAVLEPALAAQVPQQAAGALAYQFCGLSAARSAELRGAACRQAEWESERQGAPEGHSTLAIAVQLFHEFLGAHWKDHSDARRAYFDDFVVWAMSGARGHTPS